MTTGEKPKTTELQAAGSVTRALPTRPVKRSFSIAGHRTSISLEQAFWEALRDIAADEDRSLAAIVTDIDRDRAGAGLSGAVRVYVLDYYRRRARPE
jgi:predicted DNA-binding ribbon-helix-helix protein